MIIGSHVKMTSPLFLEGSVKEALGYGANALMFYTGAPQNTVRRPVSQLHIEEASKLLKENGIGPGQVIVHAPYLINPANSVRPEVAELAASFLVSEAVRTSRIGARYMILHPGSYTVTDPQTGIRTAASLLNSLEGIPEDIVICLETMAGKGSEIGRTFEELAAILELLEKPERYAVCLDTCHIHDAGYDVNDFDGVLDEFDRLIGIGRLKVIHLNDSKNERGSHKDRHENIGRGRIGFEALHRVAVCPRTASVPKILETPYEGGKPPYGEEIRMLKEGVYREKVNKEQ